MVERTYVIPLRKEMAKVPKYKHTSKAVKTVRQFLQRHMKNEIVKLGRHLNMKLHERGRKNTPHKIEVRTWTEKVKIKDKDMEIVKAEWINAPKEEVKVEEKLKKESIKVTKEDVKKEQDAEKKDEAKKEALEQPLVKNEGRKPVVTGVASEAAKKAGSVAATKETFRRDQKPINEKKK